MNSIGQYVYTVDLDRQIIEYKQITHYKIDKKFGLVYYFDNSGIGKLKEIVFDNLAEAKLYLIKEIFYKLKNYFDNLDDILNWKRKK